MKIKINDLEFEVISDRYVLKHTPPTRWIPIKDQWLPWSLEHVYEGEYCKGTIRAYFAIETDGETFAREVFNGIEFESKDGLLPAELSCPAL